MSELCDPTTMNLRRETKYKSANTDTNRITAVKTWKTTPEGVVRVYDDSIAVSENDVVFELLLCVSSVSPCCDSNGRLGTFVLL